MKPAALILLSVIVLVALAFLFIHTNERDAAPAISMKITSSAFASDTRIPSTYTCDGTRTLSPALSFENVPETAKSLVLIMDDPDVPKALKPDGVFDHWVLFNIPPDTGGIPEGGTAGTPGVNGAGKNAYTGPCPPKEYQPSEHRYVFYLYALDSMLDLPEGATKAEVLNALEGHVLETVKLTGRYERN